MTPTIIWSLIMSAPASCFLCFLYMVRIGVSTPLQKHSPSFLSSLPLKYVQTVQAPHVGQSPLFYRFLWTPPLKVKYFSERPKCFSFSSLTSSYCWKGTKFFVKISWFISLVMTEKNIFLYKLFLWLSISDSSLFFCKNSTPLVPEKSFPLFPSNPPLKIEACQALSFLSMW